MLISVGAKRTAGVRAMISAGTDTYIQYVRVRVMIPIIKCQYVAGARALISTKTNT